MGLSQIGTLILAIFNIAFANVELKPEPLKIPMRDIYRVMNNASVESRVEASNPRLGDYHLFVNTATWCAKCVATQAALNEFAQRHAKKISVLYVYDNSGQDLQTLKTQSERTAGYEFFDESRALYHLFNMHETKRDQFKPSVVFVNTQGKSLFNGYLSDDLKELEIFAAEMNKAK